MKSSEASPGSDSNSNKDKGKKIIDVDPSGTIATTNIQLEELENPKEGVILFHSQPFVKGSLLHFIVDNGI